MEHEYYQQGKLKAKQQNYQEAIANFSQAIKINSSSAEYYYQRALAYFNLGQLHPAVFDYNESIKLDSQSYQAYYGRALVKVALKNFSGALEDLEKVHSLKLNYAPAHQLKGIIYRQNADNYQAILSFEKAAKLFLAQKDADNCRICLDFIEKIKSSSSMISNSVSQSSVSVSSSNIKNTNASNIKNTNDFYQKIINLIEKGELQTALEDLKWVFQLDSPDEKAYIYRGLIYQKKGDLQAALIDFNQAINLKPEDPTGYRNRGKLRLQLKDFTGALADFNYALKLQPQDILLLLARADTYHQMGNDEKAMEDYNQAIHINPNSALAYEKRGKTYLEREEIENAIIDYQKASSIYFEHQNWKKYRHILDFLQRIQSKSPHLSDEDEAIKNLNERLYVLVGGCWEIAERLLQNIRVKYPQMTEIWYLEKVISDLEK